MSKPFLVRVDRLMKELSGHGKTHGKGLLNWYINGVDGLFHIYYDLNNVRLLCILRRDDIPIDLKTYLGGEREILGLYELVEEVFDEEVSLPVVDDVKELIQ